MSWVCDKSRKIHVRSAKMLVKYVYQCEEYIRKRRKYGIGMCEM